MRKEGTWRGWWILGADNTLHEVEVFGDEVLAVIHDGDAADTELLLVVLLLSTSFVTASRIE